MLSRLQGKLQMEKAENWYKLSNLKLFERIELKIMKI